MTVCLLPTESGYTIVIEDKPLGYDHNNNCVILDRTYSRLVAERLASDIRRLIESADLTISE